MEDCGTCDSFKWFEGAAGAAPMMPGAASVRGVRCDRPAVGRKHGQAFCAEHDPDRNVIVSRAAWDNLRDEALRWYKPDGSFERLASPEEVVARRKAAAAELAKLRGRAEAAEERERRLAEIVRRKQWVGASGRMIPPVCPDCHWTAKKGHSPDCDVGNALAAHDAAGDSPALPEPAPEGEPFFTPGGKGVPMPGRYFRSVQFLYHQMRGMSNDPVISEAATAIGRLIEECERLDGEVVRLKDAAGAGGGEE